MGWNEVTIMSSRKEFVSLATRPGANVRALCRRYGISPTTAYKWIERGSAADETYADRSRRPLHSPEKTDAAMESKILAIRDAHPVWGGRKIRRVLERQGEQAPAASTIQDVLRRNGRITEAASEAATAWHRFERGAPNELSQIDFKGYIETGEGRCYPLTMLDDHSRFAQILEACTNERTETVRGHLIASFRRFGLPWQMSMDNGNPWGTPWGDRHTHLTVWLIRLGIRVSHARPRHPQTNGKEERFHRTLNAELLGTRWFATLDELQRAFDLWREIYNHERPHEALGLEVPASRYEASKRAYPEQLPPIEYDSTDLVRKVMHDGAISFDGHRYYVSKAFTGERVALRPTPEDGCWNVFFSHERVATINCRDPLATAPIEE